MTLTFQDEQTVRKIVREEVKSEVKSQLTDFRSEMKTLLDKILKEVVANREEMVVVRGHKDTLVDHEERITVLETKVNTSAN